MIEGNIILLNHTVRFVNGFPSIFFFPCHVALLPELLNLYIALLIMAYFTIYVQKQYAALIWTSRELAENDLHNISVTKDMVCPNLQCNEFVLIDIVL
jgi:hypothetical protein